MRTSKISAKRVLGLVLAGALAVTGTVGLASTSEAAVAAVKLSPSTGSSAAIAGSVVGTVITVTGKGFANAVGASKVGYVWFQTGTCATGDRTAGNSASTTVVVSATKITVTTPTAGLALTATPKPTAYNLCIDNTAHTTVLGAAKFTSYLAPVINDNTVTSRGVTPLTGPAAGGSTIVITGENFTAKTTAKVGGLPLLKAKVDIGVGVAQGVTAGDDTITGTLPAGTAGTLAAVVVTSEGGPVTALVAQKVTYLDTVSVSPKSGNGADLNGITLTGTGFLAKTFADVPAASISAVVFKPVGALFVIGTTTPANVITAAGIACTSVQVVSDTELTCQAPDLSGADDVGGYTVMVVDFDATPEVLTQTSASASATYTVAAF